MIKLFILLSFLFFCKILFAYDWDNTPLPAEILNNFNITLNETLSDEFNYSHKDATFNNKWNSKFFNGWTGPSITLWKENLSWFKNGLLAIQAQKDPNSNKILAGCITSKNYVQYPAYVEAKVKLSDLSAMANCFWMLCEDNTQEIDILESYPTSRSDLRWFDQRIHLSHHVFIRNPFQDYQPRDEEGVYGTWYYEKNRDTWRGDFFTIGVLWKNPTHLEYFINGKWVRTVQKNYYAYLDENGVKKEYITDFNVIDKYNYTGGTNLVKPMHIIIDLEQQSWLTAKNIIPTEQELSDSTKNIYWVDWVRVYNLTEKTTAINKTNYKHSITVWPNPVKDKLFIITEKQTTFYLLDINGNRITTLHNGENNISKLKKGMYFIYDNKKHLTTFYKMNILR